MSPFVSLFSSIDPRVDPRGSDRAQLAQIDASMRWPTVFFLGKAVAWLIIATVMGLITAIKLRNPDFLADYEWLTFGRTRSACLDAFIYGWGNNVAFAVGLWIMARLCRTRVRHQGLLYIAGAFWNLGVFLGVLGILIMGPTSVEWLEMPANIMPLLAVSYVFIGLWGILSFHYREPGHVYVSQCYILAALFWFPWVYFTAHMALFHEPSRGVVQSIVNSWYVSNLMLLWFAPIALGAIYYLLPKVVGKPIQDYYLSLLGFWAYALFANWAGPRFLVYGPVPVWVQTVGVVGSVLLVVPIVIIGINHHFTAFANAQAVANSPVLRFVVFGAVSFTVASAIGVFMATRDVNIITGFTTVTAGYAVGILYAFFSMTMFGAIYFMLPRIMESEWSSMFLIKAHFWCCALGAVVLCAALLICGWKQGVQMNDPQVKFMDIVHGTSDLALICGIAGGVITIGHLAFFLNVMQMFCPRKLYKFAKGGVS